MTKPFAQTYDALTENNKNLKKFRMASCCPTSKREKGEGRKEGGRGMDPSAE